MNKTEGNIISIKRNMVVQMQEWQLQQQQQQKNVSPNYLGLAT